MTQAVHCLQALLLYYEVLESGNRQPSKRPGIGKHRQQSGNKSEWIMITSVSAVSSLCAASALLTLALHQLCVSDCRLSCRSLHTAQHSAVPLSLSDIRLSSMFMFVNQASFCSEAYDMLQI